jgi:hypothetical protein
MRSDAPGREQTTAPILLHAANQRLTAISTKPPCTQFTPSSAKRARRERRHPKASTAKKSIALDTLENNIDALPSSEGSPQTTPIPQARRLGLTIAGDLTCRGGRAARCDRPTGRSRREAARRRRSRAQPRWRSFTPKRIVAVEPLAQQRVDTFETHPLYCARHPIVERQKSASPELIRPSPEF